MELYIVRHGETYWNEEKRLQGSADIELNSYGREVAGKTGEALENIDFDCIYSSPLIRAYETACLIRGHRNIPIVRDDRIRELGFGVFEGENFSELLKDIDNAFHHFFKNPELYGAPEEGETLEELCKRAEDFMINVIEPMTKDNNRIMIVAHGAINKAIMAHIKKHDLKEFWSGGLQKNCNIIVVEYNQGKYNIIEETKVLY